MREGRVRDALRRSRERRAQRAPSGPSGAAPPSTIAAVGPPLSDAPSRMHIDIATLLFAMTVCMVTMAVALPAVMGRVNAPARRAQAGVVLQGLAWALLLLSGLAVRGSLTD